MKIRKELIAGYTRLLTMGRAVNAPDPMADLAQFDADIRSMHKRAYKEGNLDWLRLALDSLIARPAGRISQFAGQQYPFDDAELQALFRRAYGMIWPDQPLSEPGDEADLDFVEMSAEDWDAFTGNAS
ncbi:hypothetical protein J4729_06610 [Leisingera sp. HS039]|uniref:hypothetical protein n=1 Tax=unclassified Leisingera TaxID=2614906 RepID=UPI001070C298|nr:MULTISPECIES: hypothetical protein [unclassified Leisingera]MBQ4824221.1 hypothetical protein [Leisingera sp. HS039]QBR36826.1 hypothetical protein ETW23_12440 [Leisingera sp. NJS201]